MASKYMPITVSLSNRKVLVVGGGDVALRKIEMLLDYDSDITVIAPEVVDKISYFADKSSLKLEKRAYRTPEASQYGLVISAADDKAVNKMVHDDCVASGVLVNVVDSPKLCTFIVPATVKRDKLTIAVSTDGTAPFLAGFLRSLLEDAFPAYHGKVTKYAHAFRRDVHTRHKGNPETIARCFDRFLATDWKKVMKELNDEEIRERLNELLEE
jgi:uroporphyrin-III C-methyltransferase/precorrin-2 dehydrogenase/sirohydrochlorin ferrochelatase